MYRPISDNAELKREEEIPVVLVNSVRLSNRYTASGCFVWNALTLTYEHLV